MKLKALESRALRVDDGRMFLLDQTALPGREEWLEVSTTERLVDLIQGLHVRGAPLIGVAAAVFVGLKAARSDSDAATLARDLDILRAARPTAVNLMNAVDRLRVALDEDGARGVSAMAAHLFDEDVALCARMAEAGAGLIEDGDHVLTHCNTGGLATAGVGTALGAILAAHAQGKRVHVWVDETRPLLQGARLTAWELARAGVSYTLICDNMAGTLMSAGRVDRVFVGADRIAINGDFANKVGTYGLAVLCRFHSVPFFVVAPRTTIDFACAHGAEIPIEARAAREVTGFSGSSGAVTWAPAEAQVFNPAFDVTPASLVSAWVLDSGVATKPEQFVREEA